MKTIQQWTTELIERGITDFDVRIGEGRYGVVEQTFMWFETQPDDHLGSMVYFRSVERAWIDTRHFGVYALAEAGGTTGHFVYEFYGDFAAAASKLREQIIQEMLDRPTPLTV